jgi:hypothetical protein
VARNLLLVAMRVHGTSPDSVRINDNYFCRPTTTRIAGLPV